MSAKDCRQELHGLLVAMFAGSEIPIDASNIKRYATAPSETATSPNFCIVYTVRSNGRPLVIDGDAEATAVLGVKLATRLANTEASREAAEDWLDEAEAAVIDLLITATADAWYDAQIVGVRRDADRATWGMMRTSDVLVEMELR